MSPAHRLMNEESEIRNQKSEMSPVAASPRLIALSQGIYYLITGIWPLLHMPSFEKVSGPKTDNWLVRTVGVLITVIGAVLCLAAARQKPLSEPEIPTLALGSAAGLTAIDVIYVAKGRISPIYLLDALLEIVLIAAWLFVMNENFPRTGGGEGRREKRERGILISYGS